MKEIPSFSAFAAYAFSENGRMLGTILTEEFLLKREAKLTALNKLFHEFFSGPVRDYDALVGKGINAMILDNAGYCGAAYTFVTYARTLYALEANKLHAALNKRIASATNDAVGYFDLQALQDLADAMSQAEVFDFDERGTKLVTVVPSKDWPLEELVLLRTLAQWYDLNHYNHLMWNPLDPDDIELKELRDSVRVLSGERYIKELRAARK